MKSASTHKDFTDHSSVGTISSYSMWSTSSKPSMATTYIDGATIQERHDRLYRMRDSFPKGKGRPKSFNVAEKKLNVCNTYIALLPTESPEKSRSVASSAKTRTTETDLSYKNADIRNKRLSSATIVDDKNEPKYYTSYTIPHTNNAWIRRHKSMNESYLLSNLLRDHTYREKLLLKKCSYQQLLGYPSSSATSSLIKFKQNNSTTTETVESTGTHSQTQINDDTYVADEEAGGEEEELDMTGRIVADNYRIQTKLGAGSFGQVYLCEHIHSHEQWAMKIELHNMNNNPQLLIEHKIYTILENSKGFPKVDYYGSEGTFDILVIELLGPSLEDLFNYCNRKFTLKTALMLVDQMISRIEYVHTCHLIHRDIKPDNFLMGIKSTGNIVYIIDFGLSKRYRDPESLVHIPWKSNKSLTGTARYASINAHKGTEQSRRDDLEAISYVFMYFIMGTLPWQGLQATAKKAKFERIAEMKMKITPEQLCKNYPKECVLFLKYCRTLAYDNRPDYDYLRHLFRYLLYQKGEQYDYEYDWIISHRQKQLSPMNKMNYNEGETSVVFNQ